MIETDPIWAIQMKTGGGLPSPLPVGPFSSALVAPPTNPIFRPREYGKRSGRVHFENTVAGKRGGVLIPALSRAMPSGSFTLALIAGMLLGPPPMARVNDVLLRR